MSDEEREIRKVAFEEMKRYILWLLDDFKEDASVFEFEKSLK